MKKFNLILILLLLSATISNSFAQNTSVLDKKFGFQKFKFNTPPSHYSQYKLQAVEDGHFSCGNVITVTIGEFEVDKVDLYFEFEQLYRIDIELDDKHRDKNTDIYKALIANYGRPTTSNAYSTFDGSKAQTTTWKGEDVSLNYTLRTFRGANTMETKLILSYIVTSPKTGLTDDL